MKYLEDVDLADPAFGELYDELPLWSAPFGLFLLERVPMRTGQTILDVGCGTGFLTVELAQRCGETTRVIAVDPWTGGMNRLRRKIEYLGLGNVTLLEEDAASMSVPDASVDLIVSNLGVNNFEDADAVVGACFRAAKPGGSLFVTSNVAGHMAELYEVYRATLVELDRRDRLEALDAHIAHRGSLESLSSLLARGGFEVVDAETGSFRMRFADGSSLLRHFFVRLGFVGGWKSVAPQDSIEETFHSLERKLNELARARGELALTIPMVCVEARKPDS